MPLELIIGPNKIHTSLTIWAFKSFYLSQRAFVNKDLFSIFRETSPECVRAIACLQRESPFSLAPRFLYLSGKFTIFRVQTLVHRSLIEILSFHVNRSLDSDL